MIGKAVQESYRTSVEAMFDRRGSAYDVDDRCAGLITQPRAWRNGAASFTRGLPAAAAAAASRAERNSLQGTRTEGHGADEREPVLQRAARCLTWVAAGGQPEGHIPAPPGRVDAVSRIRMLSRPQDIKFFKHFVRAIPNNGIRVIVDKLQGLWHCQWTEFPSDPWLSKQTFLICAGVM